MTWSFAGRSVVVTGASRGLGRALALAFGSAGATVFVNYLHRQDEAESTRAEVEARGGAARLLPFDVRDRPAVDGAAERVKSEHGSLDVWVNNAAVADDAPFALMGQEAFERVLSVNLGGVWNGCQAASRAMLSQRRGAIVNIGSVAGLHASPGQANYSAAKGGLIALTKTLAAELAPRGLRVNAVVPGLLDVGLAARLDHRVAARYRERIPLGRFGRGEEVAHAVLFVSSEEASYLIGQVLVVDGGLTL